MRAYRLKYGNTIGTNVSTRSHSEASNKSSTEITAIVSTVTFRLYLSVLSPY